MKPDWFQYLPKEARANAEANWNRMASLEADHKLLTAKLAMLEEQRFRELVRLEATGRISRSGRDELDQLADSRRKTLSPMPVDEAALQDQRLASLRKVLGALEDYVKGFTSTNSPRPGA